MKNADQKNFFMKLNSLFALARDIRAVSAIEFALIFPILISLYMGVAEFSQGLSINRKVTQISSSVADLVSQEKTMGSSEISDIYLAAVQIILPYASGPLTIIVTSVSIDGDGNTNVDWSSSSPAGFARSTGSSVTLPNGLNEPNSGVVMTEVRYNYTSNLGKYIVGTITLEDEFYLAPRNSSTVVWQ